MANVGGLSELKPFDKATQEVVDKVKQSFLDQSGENISMFQLIGYKTQVVAGTNYFAKVQIGDGDSSYVDLRIWQKVDSSIELTSYQGGKKQTDDITYFE